MARMRGHLAQASEHRNRAALSRGQTEQGVLGRTYGRILDFSFGDRTENENEMVLKLVSGVEFSCVLYHFSSPTCLKGSWGQVWPENGPKPKLKSIF
jgi:hypothetical protein